MFCSNCGNQIPENAKFCGNCGAMFVSAEEVAATTVLNDEVCPYASEPVSEQQDDFTAPDNSFYNYTPSEPPKRKRTLLKVMAVVLSVLIVLGSCGFIFKDYFVSLWYWTKPSEEKLQYAYYKQSTATSESISDVYDSVISLPFEETSVEGSISAEVSDDLLSLVMPTDAPFNTVNIDYTVDYLPGAYSTKMSISAGKDLVMTIEYYMNIEDGTVVVKIPELNEQAIELDFSEIDGVDEIYDSFYELSALYGDQKLIEKLLPNEELIEKLLPKLVEVAFMQISDVSEEDTHYIAGDVSQKVTLLRANITEETIVNMVLAMLDELSESEDIKAYIYGLADALNELDLNEENLDGDELYSGFIDSIEDLKDSFSESDADDDSIAELRTYVDFDFNIVAVELELLGADVTFAYAETCDGKNVGGEFKIESNGTTLLSVVGKGTLENNKYTGDITLSAAIQSSDLDEILVIKCVDFNTKTADDGIYKGNITVSLGDDISDIINDNSGFDVNNISLVFDFNDSEDSYNRTILVNYRDTDIITLKTTSEVSGKADIVKPDNATDDLDEWQDGISLDHFQDLFEKWDIPLDQILGSTSKNAYAYDEY